MDRIVRTILLWKEATCRTAKAVDTELEGTRISLDSIVYASTRGGPESIQRAFPLLTLEEIYGAITSFIWYTSRILTCIWRRPEGVCRPGKCLER